MDKITEKELDALIAYVKKQKQTKAAGPRLPVFKPDKKDCTKPSK